VLLPLGKWRGGQVVAIDEHLHTCVAHLGGVGITNPAARQSSSDVPCGEPLTHPARAVPPPDRLPLHYSQHVFQALSRSQLQAVVKHPPICLCDLPSH
jgi:hypothetical protein